METFVKIQVATKDALSAVSKLHAALFTLEHDPYRLIEPGRAHYALVAACPELLRNLYDIQHRLDNKRSNHEWCQIVEDTAEESLAELDREDLNLLERVTSDPGSSVQTASASSSRRVSEDKSDWKGSFSLQTNGAPPKNPEFVTVEEATAAFEKLSKWNRDVYDECLALRGEFDDFKELSSTSCEKTLEQLRTKLELHKTKFELKNAREELKLVREELRQAQASPGLEREESPRKVVVKWLG